MAVEKMWLAVPAQALTADGTQFGVITVADTAGFRVKGYAMLAANTLPVRQVQIQRVISNTQMIVGNVGTSPSPGQFIDASAYTVALSAQIAFPEQDKNKIKADDIDQAVYEADPIVAKRVVAVDEYGKIYSKDNPIPVNADVTVNSVQLFTKPWDNIAATYPTASTEVYISSLGGVPQQQATVTYTDSTKNVFQNVHRIDL